MRKYIALIFATFCALAFFSLPKAQAFRSFVYFPLVDSSVKNHAIGIDSATQDSSLKFWHYGAQFLIGEAAFNATFFALGGSNLLSTQKQAGLSLGSIGLLASWITTPLAIHFLTTDLHLKSGSWGFGILGSVLGTFAGIAAFDQGPRSAMKTYFSYSLGIVAFAELFYDFTIWVSPSN